jgi:DNA-binding GntR family transcriptional regulator
MDELSELMEALAARDGERARALGQRHVRMAAEAAVGLLPRDEAG